MKKAYSIRIEESDYKKIVKIGGTFPKGIEKCLQLYGEKDTPDMEYPEMVGIFKDMAEFLKKYKPGQEFGIAYIRDEQNGNLNITAVKKDKLQKIADGMKTEVPSSYSKSDYHSLYNSLTPTRKQQLTEIINATKKGNYREESVEYTKNELLEKRGYSEFIGLV